MGRCMLDVGMYGKADVAEINVERAYFMTAVASHPIGVWLDKDGERCKPEEAAAFTYHHPRGGWMWLQIKPAPGEPVN